MNQNNKNQEEKDKNIKACENEIENTLENLKSSYWQLIYPSKATKKNQSYKQATAYALNTLYYYEYLARNINHAQDDFIGTPFTADSLPSGSSLGEIIVNGLQSQRFDLLGPINTTSSTIWSLFSDYQQVSLSQPTNIKSIFTLSILTAVILKLCKATGPKIVCCVYGIPLSWYVGIKLHKWWRFNRKRPSKKDIYSSLINNVHWEFSTINLKGKSASMEWKKDYSEEVKKYNITRINSLNKTELTKADLIKCLNNHMEEVFLESIEQEVNITITPQPSFVRFKIAASVAGILISTLLYLYNLRYIAYAASSITAATIYYWLTAPSSFIKHCSYGSYGGDAKNIRIHPLVALVVHGDLYFHSADATGNSTNSILDFPNS